MLTIKNFRKAVLLVLSAAILAAPELATAARSRTASSKSTRARHSADRFHARSQRRSPRTFHRRKSSRSPQLHYDRNQRTTRRKDAHDRLRITPRKKFHSSPKYSFGKRTPDRLTLRRRRVTPSHNRKYLYRHSRFYRRTPYYFFYFSLPYGHYYYDRYPYDYGPSYYRYYYGYRDRDFDYKDEYKTSRPYQQGRYSDVNHTDRQLTNVADAFKTADYPRAVVMAKKALDADPENAVLAFAYVQSLFANTEYEQAADVLRDALEKLDPDTEDVFYLFGLYPDKDTLPEQIAQLTAAADDQPRNADLQLLLGYELLGIGRYESAADAFEKAEYESSNRKAVTALREVLKKTR